MAAVFLGTMLFSTVALAAGEEPKDKTGTDPRGFGNKFMPYYRYTELKNNLEVHEMTLFGMIAFDPQFAMTYELPIAKEIDYSNVREFQQLSAALPPGQGGGGPITGVPFDDLDLDGDVVGMSDLGLRFFYKPQSLTGLQSSIGQGLTVTWMVGVEMMFPTATEDVLGNDAFIFSPLITVVHDTPTHGFFALMNFYDFDVFKEDARENVSRYRGRWFLMQPLSKPGPGLLSGIYLLPEMQPVYDFEQGHLSFWIGPELGQIVAPGKIVYVKPGFGIDPERQKGDREYTFETGFRWFFD